MWCGGVHERWGLKLAWCEDRRLGEYVGWRVIYIHTHIFSGLLDG